MVLQAAAISHEEADIETSSSSRRNHGRLGSLRELLLPGSSE